MTQAFDVVCLGGGVAGEAIAAVTNRMCLPQYGTTGESDEKTAAA